ncbi:hypothetical protein [Nitratifractor sp.]|nr:hypothetical protein [Nitratifractor sp.]
MIGEYINGALMLLIVIATVWILKSPKKAKDKPGQESRKEGKSDSTQ